MKTCLILLALNYAALVCAAQTGNLQDWTKLIDKGDGKAAEQLCSGFVNSKNVAEQVEAQKCLANAALCGNDVVLLEGDSAGGGTLRSGYKPEAVDEALLHLNAGLKLAPQDITIHEGRLHVLEVAGRYDAMIKALNESCTVYQGKDGLDAWLNYAPELMDLKQFDAGLEFMRVVDEHYPNNSDVLGNIGAFLDMMKRDSEAIPYLEKAVELAPNDPINTWDLARSNDYAGNVAEADKWYQKALPLMTDPEQKKHSLCMYAEFIETKLHNRARACSLEKANCEREKRTACSSSVRPSTAAK
jgi:tetratricopeptide (TPR) repeat protein